MSPRPAPEQLLPWALSVLSISDIDASSALAAVAGDASARRYFRVVVQGHSYMLAEAPPATEKNEAFVSVAEMLRAAGIKVPAVLGADFQRGFLLLEDLGDQTLLPLLDKHTADGYYQQAFDVLALIAQVKAPDAVLGCYDRALLAEELGRFQAWFVQELLGYTLDAPEQALLDELHTALIDSAMAQPQVLVHRDFHSRNLMLTGAKELAVIDFQDAVMGPITYDLVSLLRDCYIQWPAAQVRDWALAYCELLHCRGIVTEIEPQQFLRWFDWMGLQRHIKVLGTFARLYLRDGKSAYLKDLPLVIHYVLEISQKYADEAPVYAEFYNWFSRRLTPLIAQQPWSDAA